MTTATTNDRYVSFLDLNCDENANQLIAMLEQHLATSGKGDAQWQNYFREKQAQQAKMRQDNLHFIGSQMNNLYTYLELCEDEVALKLLWQLEQECC